MDETDNFLQKRHGLVWVGGYQPKSYDKNDNPVREALTYYRCFLGGLHKYFLIFCIDLQHFVIFGGHTDRQTDRLTDQQTD